MTPHTPFRRSASVRGAAVAAALALLATGQAAQADGVDVTPLVNENTIAVARLDVSQLKLRAVADWFQQTLHDAKVPDELSQSVVRAVKIGTQGLQPTVDALGRAGVRQVAFVVNLNEQGFREKPHVMLLIATADPDAVAAALRPFRPMTTDLDGVTVFSDPATPDYVHQVTPSPRPDLIAGIADPGNSVAIAAVSVAEGRRADLLKGLPNGRDPFDMPPAVSLFSNINIVHAHLDIADGPHVVLSADCKDVTATTNFFDGLKNTPIAADVIKVLPFTTAGQTTALELKQPHFEAIAAAATPAIQLARKQAMRVQSMSNMRSLMQSGMIYAAQNHGEIPTTLDSLAKFTGRDGKTNPALLTNPQHPELAATGYIFVPALETNMNQLKRAGQRLAIYEAGDFGEGVNVAFWDGHVEFVTDHTRFDALLAAAKTPAAAPAPAAAAPAAPTAP